MWLGSKELRESFRNKILAAYESSQGYREISKDLIDQSFHCLGTKSSNGVPKQYTTWLCLAVQACSTREHTTGWLKKKGTRWYKSPEESNDQDKQQSQRCRGRQLKQAVHASTSNITWKLSRHRWLQRAINAVISAKVGNANRRKRFLTF